MDFNVTECFDVPKEECFEEDADQDLIPEEECEIVMKEGNERSWGPSRNGPS